MAESQEDAARTAILSNFFYTAGDILRGSDALNTDALDYRRRDGLMGPPNESAGYYMGADGRYYPRGTAAGNAPAAATAAGGFVITPTMLLLGLLAVVFLRK